MRIAKKGKKLEQINHINNELELKINLKNYIKKNSLVELQITRNREKSEVRGSFVHDSGEESC